MFRYLRVIKKKYLNIYRFSLKIIRNSETIQRNI